MVCSFLPTALSWRNVGRSAFRVSRVVTMLNRSERVPKNKIVARLILVIQCRMIRASMPDSKLCALPTRHASISGLRPAIVAQHGKEGASPLPLHPSPVRPLAATETLTVSEPSGLRGGWRCIYDGQR